MKEFQIKYSKDTLKFIKKLVLAWDPDFTKVTDEEKNRISEAEKSGFVNDGDIDWDCIGVEE